MDIKSITTIKDDRTPYWNLFSPTMWTNPSPDLYDYIVQKYEEMRIDSVMLSIYPDYRTALSDVDIILYINGIDNPLNIVEGMTIKYPTYEMLDTYRLFVSDDSKVGKNVRNLLSVANPNKSTRKDGSRQKFVENNYLLPPVVLGATRDPVRTGDGTILIVGLNNK